MAAKQIPFAYRVNLLSGKQSHELGGLIGRHMASFHLQ